MGRRILIAEDDASRDVLAELLAEDGFDVCTAPDGGDALVQVRGVMPDIVITDVRMPSVDGVELVRRLRALNPGVPVLVVSAATVTRDAAMAAGANGFFSKPIDYQALVAAIRRLLGLDGTDCASA